MKIITYFAIGILALATLASMVQTERHSSQCQLPCYSESLLTRWIGADHRFVHDYCVSNYDGAAKPPRGYYSVGFATGETVERKIPTTRQIPTNFKIKGLTQ